MFAKSGETRNCEQHIPLAGIVRIATIHQRTYHFRASLLLLIFINVHAALKFGSEAWVLKKREEQRLETAQMKIVRHLLGITKLDKEKNQCIRQKNGSTEHSKGNKTVPEKVAKTCTEDGHKQTTKTSTTI